MAGDVLSKLAIVAVLAALAWFWLRPRWDVQLRADQSGLRSHRGIAEAQVPLLDEFFRRDVDLPGPISVQGQRLADGTLRFKVQGPIDEGTRQRIRNFLTSEL